MELTSIAELVATAVEVVGIATIVVGAVVATARSLVLMARRVEFEAGYRALRHGLGRAILLGLEFLVAADIIRTVAVDPSLQGLVVLGLIVLIRTFLSFALEVELEGRLPWRRAEVGGPSPG